MPPVATAPPAPSRHHGPPGLRAVSGVSSPQARHPRQPRRRRAPPLTPVATAEPPPLCRQCRQPLLALRWGGDDIAAIRVCDTPRCLLFAAPQGYIPARPGGWR